MPLILLLINKSYIHSTREHILVSYIVQITACRYETVNLQLEIISNQLFVTSILSSICVLLKNNLCSLIFKATSV